MQHSTGLNSHVPGDPGGSGNVSADDSLIMAVLGSTVFVVVVVIGGVVSPTCSALADAEGDPARWIGPAA